MQKNPIEYRVYLYPDDTLKGYEFYNCKSLEEAQYYEEMGRLYHYYKYILYVRDVINEIPLDVKPIYYEDYYDYNKPKTRKRKGR